MALFLVTRNTGRSAAMGAALVISLVMLRSRIFARAIAYLGIVATMLLLVGDFSAGIQPTPPLWRVCHRYVLFTTWFVLVRANVVHSGAVRPKW